MDTIFCSICHDCSILDLPSKFKGVFMVELKEDRRKGAPICSRVDVGVVSLEYVAS